MNYLDLFSGIGGFSLGLKQAGFKFDKHYFSEVDKYAIEVYQKQFPEAEGLGSVSNIQIRYSDSKEGKIGKGKTRIQSDRNSIRGQRNNDNSGQWSKQIDTNKHKETPEAIEYIKVRQNEQLLQRPINSRNIEECGEQSKLNTIKPKRNNNTKTTITTPNGTFQFFGKIDLITFGFPCQDLSIAGKRAGLKGSRSGLFFEATKIINVCKPSYFIFENVKGLFSSNNGECFKACLQEIADIGYDGQWQLLNTRWWLPQNRERIYFVGHIRGERRPEVFPIGENGQEPQNIQRQTSGEQQRIFSEVQESRDGDNGCPESGRRSEGRLNQIGIIGKDSEATRVYSPDGIARTIKNGGGQGAKTGLYEVSSTINKIGNLKGKGGHECHNVHDPKGIAPTVRENHGKITMIEQDIHGVELKAKPMQWRRSEKGRKARKEAMEKGKDITPFSDGHRELVESDKNEIGCITNALNKDALLSVSPTIDTTYGRTST
jgi:DNA-cytosine methyltransferase